MYGQQYEFYFSAPTLFAGEAPDIVVSLNVGPQNLNDSTRSRSWVQTRHRTPTRVRVDVLLALSPRVTHWSGADEPSLVFLVWRRRNLRRAGRTHRSQYESREYVQ